MQLTALAQPGEEGADPVQAGRPAALRVEMLHRAGLADPASAAP
jgi:hypothetical protein